MREVGINFFRIFLVVIIFLFSLTFFSGFVSAQAINDTFHINIQTTYTNGSIEEGTFEFTFNLTTSSDPSCLGPVVYNHSVTETTDSRGIVSIYLPTTGSGGGNLSALDYDTQYHLCYSRNGTLKDVSQLSRVPYSFRATQVNLSEVNIDSNLTLGNYNVSASTGFFSFLGDISNRITGLFVEDINASGDVSVEGNVTASWFSGIFDWVVGSDSQDYLTFNGTQLDFNESYLNGTVNSLISVSEPSLNVNSSNYWDGLDSPADINASDITDDGTYLLATGDTATGDYNFDSGTLFIDSTNDRVGVGTDSPSRLLHVNGSTTDVVSVFESTDSGVQVVLTDSSGSLRLATLNSGAFALSVGGDASSPTGANVDEALRVNSIGYVGINTSTPQNLLNVLGDANVTGTFYGTNADFNGGWSNGGVSIIDGEIYAQTGYFYNISSLSVTNLEVNGSLVPDLTNSFDLGNSTTRWRDLYLSGNADIDGTLYAGVVQSNDWTNVTITESQISDLQEYYLRSNPFGFYNSTTLPEGNLNVNSSKYWDGLDTPADINAGDITDDNTYATVSGESFTGNVSAPWFNGRFNWTEDSNYLSFDGTTLSFSESQLNTTIGIFNDSLAAYVNSQDLLYNNSISSWVIGNYVPYIGATQNVVLGNNNFSVGGTDFFVDSNNARVGIGTSNPSTNLEINGTSTALRISATSGNPQLQLREEGGSNVMWDVFYNPTSNTFNIGQDGVSNAIQIEDGIPSNALYIDSAGDVGIGTSSPSAKLSVNSSSDVDIAHFGNNNAQVNVIGNSGVAEIVGRNSANSGYQDLSLRALATTQLYLDTSGNVGIGTSAPNASLDLKAQSGEIPLRVEAVSSTNNLLQLGTSGSSAVLNLYDVSGNSDVQLHAAGDSYFAGGNLGINTSTPQNTLNVDGDANITQTAYIGGTTVFTDTAGDMIFRLG